MKKGRQTGGTLFAEWDAEQRRLKEEKDAEEKRTWQMDSELSSATLTITPVELADGKVVYRLHDAIEILPYPNPLGFGGSWGSGSVDSEIEAMEREQLFLKTLSTWDIMDHGSLKDHGMTRISVVWEDRTTSLQHLNGQRAKAGEDQPLLLV